MKKGRESNSSEFPSFCALYLVAVAMNSAVLWEFSYHEIGAVLFYLWLRLVGVSPRSFFLFLVFSVACIFKQLAVSTALPTVLFMELGFSLVFLAAILSVSRFPAPEREREFMARIKPILRYLVMVVYVLAGFHKLNAGFFDPGVSCAGWVVRTLAAFAGAGHAISPLFIQLSAGLAVCVELLGGFLLLFKVSRSFSLLSLVALHLVLSLLGFAVFSALMLAGMSAFVSEEFWQTPPEGWTVDRGGALSRVGTYAWINLGGILLSALLAKLRLLPPLGVFAVHGLVFDASVLILLVPFVSAALRRGNFFAVGMSFLRIPAWGIAAVAAWFINGLSPYLGLHSAGNFSMFSNLRTEDHQSNHLVWPNGWLRLWNYDDDLVWVERADKRVETLFPRPGQRESLIGKGVPAEEFKKWVWKWKASGLSGVAVDLRYRGQRLTYADITQADQWAPKNWNLMMSLKSRIVQAGGANECRY